MSGKEDFILRTVGELVPQKNDTFCVWGTRSRDAVNALKDRGYRAGNQSLGLLLKPDGVEGLRFMFGLVVCELEWVRENNVYPTLSVLRKCHTEAIQFFISKKGCPNQRQPEYWAAKFASVFPYFKFSDEEHFYVVTAYPRNWRTED